MTFLTYIRSDTDASHFVKHSSHPTYKLASETGFAAGGYGNFLVETKSPAYVPSCAEQLLEDVKPRSKRQLTVTLAMED